MSWLDRVFFRGLVSVQTAGTALPAETTLNFTGAGVVVTDDPTNGRTNVAIAGGGSNLATLKACTLEDFGAVGDGTTDDVTAFTAAMNAVKAGTYGVLLLGAKTYKISGGGFTWNGGAGNGGAVIGVGPKSVLKWTGATVGLTGLFLLQNLDSVVFKDFMILGDGVSSQRGMLVGTAASDAPQNTSLDGVWFRSLALSGIHSTNAPLATSQVCQMTHCRVDTCGIGIVVGAQMNLTNVDISSCPIGIQDSAGNLTAVGCLISENTTGIQLQAGGNDGHGIFSGCTFNHNVTNNIEIQNIANGMTFSGCHSYAGNVSITGNTGIVDFVGCSVQPINITFDNCLVRFADTRLNTDVFAAANFNNNPQVEFTNVRDLLGNVPSFVQARIQAPVTPVNGANTLTKTQSVAEMLNLLAGASAAVTITSTLAPGTSTSRKILIKNNTTQTVTYAWSSGTGVTIATLKSALVGSDGTNAIILMQGA